MLASYFMFLMYSLSPDVFDTLWKPTIGWSTSRVLELSMGCVAL